MSRLNRAFIKAFEREPATNASTAVLDRAAPEPRQDFTTAVPLAPEQPSEELAVATTITRVDMPVQFSLPHVVPDVSLPRTDGAVDTFAARPTAVAPDDSQLVAEPERDGTAAIASAEPLASTWTPPYLYDGPTDWRSVVIENRGIAQRELAEEAAPTLPTDFFAKTDSFRLDPSHAPQAATQPAPMGVPSEEVTAALEHATLQAASAVWVPPQIELSIAASTSSAALSDGLNEPALQVDRFAWPSVCLTLLEKADAPFAGLVDELFAGVTENRKLLAVTGYRRGSGRTTFLLSTARALAARGARVVIADADWDTPHLAERLGVSPEVGWQDVLTSGLPLEEALIESLIDGVTLLPARPNRSRTRTINFSTAEQNLQALRHAYDFVLLDAGRLDDSTEGKIGSILLEKMPIEGVLLVHDVSTSSMINPSITESRLDQMQIRWWRVVENFVRHSK